MLLLLPVLVIVWLLGAVLALAICRAGARSDRREARAVARWAAEHPSREPVPGQGSAEAPPEGEVRAYRAIG